MFADLSLKCISKHWIQLSGAGLLFGFCSIGQAMPIVYDTWTTNEGGSGNYILTLTPDGDSIDFELNVDPWNAEALGLFFDFGDFNFVNAPVLGPVSTFVQQTGPNQGDSAPAVSLDAFDTTSSSCLAGGCNLNGGNGGALFVPESPDGQWELIFGIGSQGFDGIQSASWSITSAGADFESLSFGSAAVRAQNYCATGVLPDGSCDGSDKSISVSHSTPVPEPSSLALIAIGLFGFSAVRRFGKSV